MIWTGQHYSHFYTKQGLRGIILTVQLPKCSYLLSSTFVLCEANLVISCLMIHVTSNYKPNVDDKVTWVNVQVMSRWWEMTIISLTSLLNSLHSERLIIILPLMYMLSWSCFNGLTRTCYPYMFFWLLTMLNGSCSMQVDSHQFDPCVYFQLLTMLNGSYSMLIDPNLFDSYNVNGLAGWTGCISQT